MIVAGARHPILIATKPLDFRCGHQALALVVQTELKLDPHSGVTVIFRSKRGDRLKILVWDGTGIECGSIRKDLKLDHHDHPSRTSSETAPRRGPCQPASVAPTRPG